MTTRLLRAFLLHANRDQAVSGVILSAYWGVYLARPNRTIVLGGQHSSGVRRLTA